MTSATTPPRVLIVDDDPLARETLGALLMRERYILLFAASGTELLQKIGSFAPDIILLDVVMPDMSGFEVCQKLKSMPEHRHIPIVLVTALDETTDLVRGLDSGADEFISKPLSSLELRARVRSMLRIKQQYDALQRTLQARDTLSHMIVHDIRNPLSAVTLNIQLLKRKANLTPEQIRILDVIYNQANDVSAFLEDLLLLTRLDASGPALTLEPLNMDKILAAIQEKAGQIGPARQVAFHLSEQTPRAGGILVDMHLFQRALINLAYYAIKAAPANTTVTMQIDYPRLSSNQPDAPQLRVTAQHDGPRLPAEDLEQIFDIYAALDRKQPPKSPAGLELAYCRVVITAHGGAIKAANREPQGILLVAEL
jgi:two-component system sensor histidine kinase/response regulator